MEEIEESDFIASEHDKLISAVSKLDKTQYITEPTRNETTILNSEFNLIKRSNKLNLSDVAKVLEEKSNLRQISKKLLKSHDAAKILPIPLEKPQSERLKRATGYEETKKKVGRWDPVVAKSRTSEYVSFPLKHISSKMAPTNEFLTRFELKSELERELEEIDPPMVPEEEEEEEKIYPMSYEEMVEHRQHLAKIRAQQTYKLAKAKRQSKIKSKKFHRVLKKERLKLQLKEFEELQKTNPEEALKKLEAIEKARALERHTLRHKNTGKWAKNKMIRAKYDKDVRQQIAEQLAVSRSLTKKTDNIESSDDDAENNEGIADIDLSQDPMNPWMLKQSNKSNVSAEFDFGYKNYLKGKMLKRRESESDSDDVDNDVQKQNNKDESNDLNILKESIKSMAQRANKITLNSDNDNVSSTIAKNYSNSVDVVQSGNKVISAKVISTSTKQTVTQTKKSKIRKPIATTSWTVEEVVNNKELQPKSIDISTAFQTLESNVVKKVGEKLKVLRRKIERMEKDPRPRKRNKKTEDHDEVDNLEYLKMKTKKKVAIIDEALLETGSKNIDDVQVEDITKQSKIINTPINRTDPETSANIDPNTFIEVKPKYLNTALPQGENNADLLDEEDEQVVPRVNIEEVFEEDDVVASFRQEKDEEINKDKPEDIDFSLPGWGSWGGKGVKAPKRKKNRFILKCAPKMPRRDENKGDIIIKEYRDPKLSAHKVKEIPYPFNSVRDYEASIRAPLGNTFIPERAHKKLIRPSVITKAGAIIEPMDEDELLVKKNKSFMNENVLKIMGRD